MKQSEPSLGVKRLQSLILQLKSAGQELSEREFEQEAINVLFQGRSAPFYDFNLTSAAARLGHENLVPVILIPTTTLIAFLKNMSREDIARPKYLEHVAKRYLAPGVITSTEYELLLSQNTHLRLKDFGLHNRLSRFESSGIYFGEPERMVYDQLESRVTAAPAPYYVYCMYTPQGGLFYVGKGRGKRILQHELELLKEWLPVHTNWKKINKIAQILVKGRHVIYRIDSWHQCEQSALLREVELIIIHERLNPWLLTNSNGSRYLGKPSIALNEWRIKKGLPPANSRYVS